MIKAVLFDLGDTVIANDSIDLGQGLCTIFKDYIQNEEFIKLVNDTFKEISERTVIEYDINEFFQKIVDHFAFEITDDLETKFFLASCHDHLMEGIVDALVNLKQKGIITGIVSNSIFHQEVLKEELERLKIANYFSFILASANVGYRKPDKHIFDAAYSMLKEFDQTITKDEILFIGDHYEVDYLGAASYGFHALLLNSGEEKNGAKTIKHLKDLNDYIVGLNR